MTKCRLDTTKCRIVTSKCRTIIKLIIKWIIVRIIYYYNNYNRN